ncbi:hypothetical protein PIB30_044749 [Stylosanthes scabra]|uniref:Uncharacterized protein n=1 Tax=Stylosanthes scabra TaxID=79078 RepID=A0ABU6ZEN9_9FABA|nr:hypothetical protein [Stylosanthes scabra]
MEKLIGGDSEPQITIFQSTTIQQRALFAVIVPFVCAVPLLIPQTPQCLSSHALILSSDTLPPSPTQPHLLHLTHSNQSLPHLPDSPPHSRGAATSLSLGEVASLPCSLAPSFAFPIITVASLLVTASRNLIAARLSRARSRCCRQHVRSATLLRVSNSQVFVDTYVLGGYGARYPSRVLGGDGGKYGVAACPPPRGGQSLENSLAVEVSDGWRQ